MTEDPYKLALRTIGERLRRLRLAKGMSLRQAARTARLSPSFISMIERGETEIAISRLIRLADSYGVVVADLLDNVHEPAVEYTPAGQGHDIPHLLDEVVVSYLSSPSWSMQPFIVRLQPGALLKALSHPGEEFLYCIEGQPKMVVSGDERPLSAGDTLYLPAHAVHTYSNPGDGVAVILGAVRRQESGDQHVVPRAHEAVGKEATKA
jgi:transcriptional regulator with XRE-family HTH domain/mannose-6-phosphate isomerase-like protein (cupin superfamily)